MRVKLSISKSQKAYVPGSLAQVFYRCTSRGVKRLSLFLIFLSASAPLFAESDAAYLILKATLTNKGKQPTWICMARTGTCVHIPADQELVKIKPGKYRLHHIDFTKSQHSGEKTQFFRNSMKFTFEANNIYFIGNLKLTRKRPKKFAIEVDQDTSLIGKACAFSPSVFEKYPVTDLTGTKKLKFSCNEDEHQYR